MKHPSGSQVPKLPKQTIEIDLYNVIAHLLDTKEINYTLMKELSKQEKKLFNLLMDISGLSKQLNYKKNKIEASEKDLKLRYNVLSGEIEAGNNNDEIKEELIEVIQNLVNIKAISKKDSVEMIEELNLN